MAYIAIMVGGAVLNAVAFIGGNYLVKAFNSGDKAAQKEREGYDKAMEAYKLAYNKDTLDHTKLLDWIAANMSLQTQAKQDLTNTDYAIKLYNQAHHLNKHMAPPREPTFSDFYQLSEQQKNGELVFVGTGALALGYAAFQFL